jgi:hypothetical protein
MNFIQGTLAILVMLLLCWLSTERAADLIINLITNILK